MRAGLTPALIQRLRNPSPTAKVMVEARIQVSADIIQVASGNGQPPWGWQDCDGSLSGSLEILADGGLRLKPTAAAAVGPSTQNAWYRSYEPGVAGPWINPVGANTRGPATVCALVVGVWAAPSSYSAVQVYLNPQYDTTKPKYVKTWRVTIYDYTGLKLVGPIIQSHIPAASSVAGWVVFPFQDNLGAQTIWRTEASTGPTFGPDGDPGVLNQYLILVHGFDANGDPATNIALGYDNAHVSYGLANASLFGATIEPSVDFDPTLVDQITLLSGAGIPAFQLIPVSVAASATATFADHQVDVTAENLFDNPDFEEDLSGATSSNGATIVQDSAQAHRGLKSVKVTTANTANSGINLRQRPGDPAHRMPVTVGLTYEFWGWVYADVSAVGKSLDFNIRWAAANGSVISVATVTTVLVLGGQIISVVATAPAGAVAATCQAVSHGAIGVWTFWLDDISFAAVPTVDVEFVIRPELPAGTSVTPAVQADDGTWLTFKDRQTLASLNAANPSHPITVKNHYAMRVTLNANSGSDLTPIVRGLGAAVVTAADLGEISDVTEWSERVDPLTHQAEVGEVVITAIHDGARDFRDRISQLLSQNVPGQMVMRAYVGDRGLSKDQWLLLEDFLIDDTDFQPAAVQLTCVSYLAALRQALPKLASDDAAVPIADLSNAGLWTESAGSSLFPLVADVASDLNGGAPDDTTYIESANNPSSAQCVLQLSPVGTPTDIITGQVQIQCRAAVAAGGNSVNLKLELLEGVTLRATLGSVTVTTAYNGQGSMIPLTYALTAAEIAAIVDWSNLFLRFTATGTGKVRVGWARVVQLGARFTLEYPSVTTPGNTVAEVLADLIYNQVAVEGHLIGSLYQDPASFPLEVAKSIETDASGETNLSRAKEEIDALLWIAGWAMISSQGRLRCVPFYEVTTGLDPVTGDNSAVFAPRQGPVVAKIPMEEIEPVQIVPGWRQRCGLFSVPWGWNGTNYVGEAQVVNLATEDTFPPALIDPIQRCPETAAKWIASGGLANGLGVRHTQMFGLGLLEWRFRCTYAYPELEIGDVIMIGTDQFLAYDPIATRAIVGKNWATGVIVGKWDAIGREFSIWIPSYSAIAPIAGNGTPSPNVVQLGYASFIPEISPRNWDIQGGYARPNGVGSPLNSSHHSLTPSEIPQGATLAHVRATYFLGTAGGGVSGTMEVAVALERYPIGSVTPTTVVSYVDTTATDAWQTTEVPVLLGDPFDWTQFTYDLVISVQCGTGVVDDARFASIQLEWA